MKQLDNLSLHRRDLLRSAFLLVGAASVADPARAFAAVVASGPKFFSPAQFALVDEVSEIIIPRTDTPGARDAKVAASIDALMANWASPATAEEMRTLVDLMDQRFRQEAGAPLLRLAPAKRIEAVRKFDAAELNGKNGYGRFKQLVLLSYYWSEPGATKELRYELAPGVWEASIPLKPNQPAWAV